jgi:hypothetical protein
VEDLTNIIKQIKDKREEVKIKLLIDSSLRHLINWGQYKNSANRRLVDINKLIGIG